MAAVHHAITPVVSGDFGWAQITDLAVWDPWQHIPCAHGSETIGPIYLAEAILMSRP